MDKKKKKKKKLLIMESGRKQKRLGPAPIASFEDISDEVRQKVCITLKNFPFSFYILFFFLIIHTNY